MSQNQNLELRRGEKNPKWRGGKTVERTGRVLIYAPNHPHPNWKNYVYRYRLVVEQMLGRPLLPNELVHHKNGNPSDDRPENLEVHSRNSHSRLHSIAKLNGRWSLLHHCCVECLDTEFKHHAKGLCEHCYDKKRNRK